MPWKRPAGEILKVAKTMVFTLLENNPSVPTWCHLSGGHIVVLLFADTSSYLNMVIMKPWQPLMDSKTPCTQDVIWCQGLVIGSSGGKSSRCRSSGVVIEYLSSLFFFLFIHVDALPPPKNKWEVYLVWIMTPGRLPLAHPKGFPRVI